MRLDCLVSFCWSTSCTKLSFYITLWKSITLEFSSIAFFFFLTYKVFVSLNKNHPFLQNAYKIRSSQQTKENLSHALENYIRYSVKSIQLQCTQNWGLEKRLLTQESRFSAVEAMKLINCFIGEGLLSYVSETWRSSQILLLTYVISLGN